MHDTFIVNFYELGLDGAIYENCNDVELIFTYNRGKVNFTFPYTDDDPGRGSVRTCSYLPQKSEEYQ